MKIKYVGENALVYLWKKIKLYFNQLDGQLTTKATGVYVDDLMDEVREYVDQKLNSQIKHEKRYGPYMTSNNAPAPFMANSSQNSWGAFRAFSESLDDDITFTGLAVDTEQWVQVRLDLPIRIWSFRILCRTTISAKDAGQVAKDFTVLGSNDGLLFETIKEYKDVDWQQFTSWNAQINKYDWSDAKRFEVTPIKAYQFYRFSFGECQSISPQKFGPMTPTLSNTVKITLIDLYQIEAK